MFESFEKLDQYLEINLIRGSLFELYKKLNSFCKRGDTQLTVFDARYLYEKIGNENFEREIR